MCGRRLRDFACASLCIRVTSAKLASPTVLLRLAAAHAERPGSGRGDGPVAALSRHPSARDCPSLVTCVGASGTVTPACSLTSSHCSQLLRPSWLRVGDRWTPPPAYSTSASAACGARTTTVDWVVSGLPFPCGCRLPCTSAASRCAPSASQVANRQAPRSFGCHRESAAAARVLSRCVPPPPPPYTVPCVSRGVLPPKETPWAGQWVCGRRPLGRSPKAGAYRPTAAPVHVPEGFFSAPSSSVFFSFFPELALPARFPSLHHVALPVVFGQARRLSPATPRTLDRSYPAVFSLTQGGAWPLGLASLPATGPHGP